MSISVGIRKHSLVLRAYLNYPHPVNTATFLRIIKRIKAKEKAKYLTANFENFCHAGYDELAVGDAWPLHCMRCVNYGVILHLQGSCE